MSEISPTPSQQLAAAAIAFHRARRKFTENIPESLHKNPERIQVNNKTENTTRLRVASGFCCGRNCEPVESAFHKEKKSRDAVRDFVKIVSNKKYKDSSMRDNDGTNELEEFKDAQDRFNVSNEINDSRPIYKKNCPCFHRMSMPHKKSNDGVAINQLHKSESPDIDDRKNDDELLDFPRKLYEWERRSREESLMKMQRFHQRRSRMKQETKCQSLHNHSHCCQVHYCSKIPSKPAQIQTNTNWSNCPAKLHCQKFINEFKYDIERECKNYSNGKVCHALNSGMRSVPEESENDDEESMKNVRQIKHRDSVDILVEKLKSKRIQAEQIEKVGELCSATNETVSCSEVDDQLVSNETTKESKSCEDNVDSETCCSRKKSSTKELRFNKLADRLKHKSRRSRLTKSVICYNDESTTTT